MRTVTLIPGDGTGPELTSAMRRVVDGSGAKLQWEVADAGEEAAAKHGTPLPQATLDSIRRNRVAIKGPISTPIGSGYRSVNVAMRKEFDLYAGIRPCKTIPGIPSKFSDVDLVIVRENTEDLYMGIEHWVGKDAAESIRIITREGSRRIAHAAFEYAARNARRKVTIVHKANIQKFTDGLFLDSARDVAKDYPPPSELLAVTQSNLDGLAQFVRDKKMIDLPPAPAARVAETPPFLRATTSASMDTPGPFETVATEAYFYMTLPDPTWPKEEQDDFMSQWYRPTISNVSVHEVWPGHYVQFLYAKDYPSDVRKVFATASNFEGWAHYCEQMMLDEGLHADDPRYRLAQAQDALLRDVRFIVGIKMHTQDMTIEQARDMFVNEGYQPEPVAESEAKRGTSDATYGYYTMGKLMILKLRDDYKAKMGDAYSLKGFHDAFIKLGPLPLPLIRKAMLGDVGDPF